MGSHALRLPPTTLHSLLDYLLLPTSYTHTHPHTHTHNTNSKVMMPNASFCLLVVSTLVGVGSAADNESHSTITASRYGQAISGQSTEWNYNNYHDGSSNVKRGPLPPRTYTKENMQRLKDANDADVIRKQLKGPKYNENSEFLTKMQKERIEKRQSTWTQKMKVDAADAATR